MPLFKIRQWFPFLLEKSKALTVAVKAPGCTAWTRSPFISLLPLWTPSPGSLHVSHTDPLDDSETTGYAQATCTGCSLLLECSSSMALAHFFASFKSLSNVPFSIRTSPTTSFKLQESLIPTCHFRLSPTHYLVDSLCLCLMVNSLSWFPCFLLSWFTPLFWQSTYSNSFLRKGCKN